MNALATALPREVEVQSKIRKIRAFGQNARIACSVLFSVGIVVCAIFLLTMFIGVFGVLHKSENSDGGTFDLIMSPLTPLLLKLCFFLATSIAIGVWLAAVFQLYRLFGSLASGAIYTSENVRRIRYVGLLWLLWAVLGIAIPATLAVAHRLIDASVPIDFARISPSFSELLNSFVAAGLVLLVSWIMDVGLYEKEHADELRRDADLTI